jgi:bifunctional DNA-binding transcriptional regulator/antitoxin component of YhaV-PrlF toxin-antitoxin module
MPQSSRRATLDFLWHGGIILAGGGEMSLLPAAEAILEQYYLNVGPQGRIVIPVALRRAWGLEQGETLIARLEGDRVFLERPLDALESFKRSYPQLRDEPNMIDELIAERRLEAAREDAESAP